MKHTLVLAATVLAAFTASARVLSPADALRRAAAQNPGTMQQFSISQTDVTPVLTKTVDNAATLYVFDRDNAYAVVSADDCTPALLGYGDNGAFDVNNMPPALRYWLDQYAAQINYARQNGAPAYMPAKATAQYAAIEPMTLTRWNQDAPYNNDCPEYDGQRSVTGCVATALAQIMKWHSYPPKGTGTASYTYQGQELSFDYGSTTFNWDDMINVYTSESTAAQNAAVATLMYANGVGVQMQYSPSDSGSDPAQVPQLMVKHYGYDRGVRYLSRDFYTAADWQETVYNNLKEYGPCQYNGQSSDGGHSFVCDGYSRDGYFHINWGWGGMSDGYFLLSALDPESQGIGGSTSGYNYDQSIIACVKNGDNGTPTGTPFVQMYAEQSFQPSASQVSLGQQMSFSGGFYNFSADEISGTLGIKLVSSTGRTSYIEGNEFNSLPIEAGYTAFPVVLPSSLAAGTYTVSPALLPSGGQWQDIPVKLSGVQNLTMTVQNGTATFANGKDATLSATAPSLTTPIYVGSSFKVSTTVTNTSDTEFYGGVTLVLVNTSGQAVATAADYPLDLQPGESTDLDYISSFTTQNVQDDQTTSTDVTAGTYYICFATSTDMTQISPMTQATVNAAVSSVSVSATKPVVANASAVDPDNFSVTSTVTCSEGYFGGTMMLVVFPYEDGQSVSSVAAYSTDEMFLNAGDSQDIKVDTRFTNAVSGKRYFCALYNGQNPISQDYGYFTVSNTNGIDDIVGNNPVVATKYYNLQGQIIENTTVKPGLYIVSRTFEDGTTRTQRQLIR